jgi:hypothetical protein
VDWDRIKNPVKEHHNSISLDQYVAERIKADTRYRNLVIGPPVQWNFSWNERGVPVPTERSPSKVFKQLFINGSADEVASETHRLQTGRSILDQVGAEAKSFGKKLGTEDRERLELMFSSIRETEQNLLRSEAWVNRPKPSVDYAAPKADPNGEEIVARETLWFDITRLAFQTDSTRVILLTMGDAGRPKLEGVSLGHHDASHHAKDETKIAQLATIEETELRQLSRFFTTMQQAKEGNTSLFDSTSILNVSNLSNASAHTCENLPVILAGGGYKHQGHVLKDIKSNTPLSNLFVRMLQQVGIETTQFGASEGILDDV